MDHWEQRVRKLAAREARIAKHGRSLMGPIRQAEMRRAAELRQRAARRQAARKKA